MKSKPPTDEQRGPHAWRSLAPVDVVAKRNRVFLCPGCNSYEFSVEHIFSDGVATFGPWYCEHCGAGWFGAQARGGLSLKPAPNRSRRVRIELEMRPHDEPLRVTIERMMVRDDTDDLPIESAAYLYEEHMCAESIMHEVTTVALGEKSDPHGLFELVGFAEVNEK